MNQTTETNQLQQTCWNYKDVATFLKCSENTLRQWVMRNQIPYYKIGGKFVRFSPEQIMKWMQRQEIKARG